jgi:hypothetical protein
VEDNSSLKRQLIKWNLTSTIFCGFAVGTAAASSLAPILALFFLASNVAPSWHWTPARISCQPFEIFVLEKVMPTQLVAFLASLASHCTLFEQWQHLRFHCYATGSKHENKRPHYDNLWVLVQLSNSTKKALQQRAAMGHDSGNLSGQWTMV